MIQTDRLILNQAILRHKERQVRQKRDIPIPHGPGWLRKGSIFDGNRKNFEKALRAYSDRLYVGWNPMKNDGNGCWEIWHRPSRKTAVLQYYDEKTGFKLYSAEYQPNDFEHWVADLDFLDINFIGKLRNMDSWENKQLISGHDDKTEEEKQKLEQNEDEHLKYVVRHNKQAFRDLLDYTQAGFNPLQFFNKK